MDLATTAEPPEAILPLRATKTDYRLLGVFVFLSFFELPIIWIGKDAIGLYDVFIWVVVIYLLFRTRGLTARMPWAWRTYFIAMERKLTK